MNYLVAMMIRKIRAPYRELRVYNNVIGRMGFIYCLSLRQNDKRLIRAKRITGVEPYLRDLRSDVHLCHQIFWSREYDIDFPFEPKTIIDAGANIGLSALWFKQRFPDATIVAIEPVSDNYALLRRNCPEHQGYILYPAALWYRTTELVMKDWGTGLIGYAACERIKSSESDEDIVPSITLSEIINRHGLPRPLLLKLDIEGGEKALFEHAEEWVHLVDGIVAELHDRKVPGCTEAFDLLKRYFPINGKSGENEYCFRRLKNQMVSSKEGR